MKVVFLLLDDNFDFFHNLERVRAYVRAEWDVPQDEIGALTDLDVVIKPFYSIMTFTACTNNTHSVVVIEPGKHTDVDALVLEIFKNHFGIEADHDHPLNFSLSTFWHYNAYRGPKKLIFYVYNGSRYGLMGLTAGTVGIRVPKDFTVQDTKPGIYHRIRWETELEVYDPVSESWRRVKATVMHYETSAPKEWGLRPDELVVRDAEGRPVGAIKMKDVPDPTTPIYFTPGMTGKVWTDLQDGGVTPANLVHPSFIRFFKTAEVIK